MAQLKIVPKIIIGIGVLAISCYGINYWLDNRPKTVVIEKSQELPASQKTEWQDSKNEKPMNQEPASQPIISNDGGMNAGLQNLLNKK